MPRLGKIHVNDLLVNTENYRFDTVGSQKDAIAKMVQNQEDKLYSLAEHIIAYGLDEYDPLRVAASNHDSTKYNVLEGNRRTVTLKILHHPEIIDDIHKELKRKFRKLHSENAGKLIEEVSCVIYDDPKEADVWIGLKHGYGPTGVGTDNWTPLQKDRFQEKTEGKTSITIQFIGILKDDPDVPSEVKNSIETIRSTNLTRLFDDPDVREFLGFEINNGVIESTIDKKEVVKGFTKVAKDLLTPEFTVSKIYSKDDRKDYMASFPKEYTPDTNRKALKPWSFDGSTSESKSKPGAKIRPNPKDRNRLIPKSCILVINNPKVNKIYYELQKELDIYKHTNAIAVLLRVFVELSVDTFIETNNILKGPALSSTESGEGLEAKVNRVINYLGKEGLASTAFCRGLKTAVNDRDDILGITTWHAYVHNNKFSPKAESLITTWDNIQDFMIILWKNVK